MIDVAMGGGTMWMLADVALKGVVILTLAAGAALILRRGSAAARHWTWLLGLLGVLLLPVAGWITPEWRIALPVPGASGGEGLGTVPIRAAPQVPSDNGAAPIPFKLAGAREAGAGSASPATDVVPAGADREASGASGVGSADPSSPRAGRAGLSAPQADLGGSAGLGAAVAGGDRPGVPWVPVAVTLWAVGAVLLLVRVSVHHRALREMETRATVLSDPGVQALAATLRREMGIRRRVRLLEGAPDAMPMSWGTVRPALLLPAGAAGWSRSRLATVLLHEFAHVKRWDCLAQLVAEVVVALHWINPLTWFAAHRLRVEREHACDDIVLHHGARPTAYASDLVGLARDYVIAPAASAGMAMSGPSHLRERVVALLDARRPRRLPRRAAAAGAVLAGAAVLALASVSPARAGSAPSGQDTTGAGEDPGAESSIMAVARKGDALPSEERVDAAEASRSRDDGPWRAGSSLAATLQETTCGMAQDGWRSTSVQSRNDERITMEWSRPGCTVEVRIEGDLEFTDDFRDIARLSSDGSFRLEEDDRGTERWLEITPGAGGRPEYEYRVGRDERPFDATARSWYEAMLLQVFRRSGIAAEERVAALLRTGGQAAVMDEIDQLGSDHVFAVYVEQLILQADLSEQEAVQLVETAAERVESDHYTAQILLALADRHLTSDQGVDAFLRATRTLESDHYRAEVLSHALERRELERDQVLELVRAVNGMESDHYTAEVLGSVAQRYFLDAEMRQPYLQAVMTVESDHYKAQLLQSLLDRGDLSAQETQVVLEAVAQMESDHYKAEILKGFGRDLDGDQIPAYLELARSVESDHYRSEILLEMVSRDLTDAQMVQTIRAVEIMEGDHYKAAVLEEIIRATPERDGPVYDALVEAVDSVESRHYRGQLAEMLLTR